MPNNQICKTRNVTISCQGDEKRAAEQRRPNPILSFLETSRISLQIPSKQPYIYTHIHPRQPPTTHGVAPSKGIKNEFRTTPSRRKKNNRKGYVGGGGGEKAHRWKPRCVYFSAESRQMGHFATRGEDKGFEERERGGKKNSTGKTGRETNEKRGEKRRGDGKRQRNISSYLNLHERAEQRGFSIQSRPSHSVPLFPLFFNISALCLSRSSSFPLFVR